MEEFVSQIEDMKSQIASLRKTKKPVLVESATCLNDLHKVSQSCDLERQSKVIFQFD